MFAIGVGCRVGCEASVTGSLLALGMLLPYSTTPPDGAAHIVAVDGRQTACRRREMSSGRAKFLGICL